MRWTLSIAAAAAAVLAVGVAPASADHVHFRVLGNGDCVLLAPDGGEQHVVLPNAEGFPENRRHPLHVNVHLGEPGMHGQIFVAYPASGVLTPEALAYCGGEFVNR
jgi:hypothetical protein